MGPLGRFFRGESTSEVGLDGGLTRDVWTAMQPDLRVLNPAIREGNRLARDLPPEAQAVMIAALSQRYVRQRAAGDVPADREPDGDVDLDRRADRARAAG